MQTKMRMNKEAISIVASFFAGVFTAVFVLTKRPGGSGSPPLPFDKDFEY
jgi:hypothetical protein